MYCNTKKSDSQSLSAEISEIFNNYKPKKKFSVLLSESFQRLSKKYPYHFDTFFHRFERSGVCAHYLEFAKNIDNDGVVDEASTTLIKALFCRDRLCPMCQWRRSLLVFGQVFDIMNLIRDDYKFALLTLTVPNVSPEGLRDSVKKLLSDFKLYMLYKDIKSVILGYYRSLEVTYNREADTFHPHLHIVLVLPKSYGGREYISREKWLDLWRKATGDESITQVDIRIIKNLEKAVAEVVKYTLKGSDYIFPDNPELTDYCVYTLSQALKNVRSYGFAGVFREAYQKLHFEDVESENVDLLGNRRNKKLVPSMSWLILVYKWIKQDYISSDCRIEIPELHAVNKKKTE